MQAVVAPPTLPRFSAAPPRLAPPARGVPHPIVRNPVIWPAQDPDDPNVESICERTLPMHWLPLALMELLYSSEALDG